MNPSSSMLSGHFPPNQTNLCQNDDSMTNLYLKAMKEKNLPSKLINLWSIIELDQAFFPTSAYASFFDTPESYQRRSGNSFHEIINGTSVLPNSIKNNITNQDTLLNVNIEYNSFVEHVIVNADDTVTIKTRKDNKMKKRSFDKLILTPTSRVVSSMKFSPPLAYNKTYALNSFHFMNSVKVFLAFHSPFWANETKIPPIPFDSSTTVNGGTGINDLPIRSIFYPSHSYHGYALLVSYTWGDDADRLSSFSEEDLIRKSLENLVEIHGEVAREQYKEGKVKKWMEEDWTAGAFAWALPGQMHELGQALREHHTSNVFFAGEYTSKVSWK